MPRPATRRQLLRSAGALAALGTVGAGGFVVSRRHAESGERVIPLWSSTVAYARDGQRVLVGGRGVPLDLAAGTRCAADLPQDSPVRERAAQFTDAAAPWLARVERALGAERAELGRSALADLWVLSDGLPAPVAGWSESWRYVWPRDTAFCAVALARVGLVEQARAWLTHVQTWQEADRWFPARLDPVHGRAPDDRPRQFDGTGLLLWAATEVIAASARSDRADVAQRLGALTSRSLAALQQATAGGTGFPPVSPDYWELPEQRRTLGIMTCTLTGLRAGAELTGEARDMEAAEAFTALLLRSFGAAGFPRHRHGGGADSALAFLDATGVHDVASIEQLRALRETLARPAGGIAPGARWRQDGVSWTPSTSLLGLALARAGDPDSAGEILDWLAAHRTEHGSLPEKVLFDGRPAEVAPLAWTAANVLITLDELVQARP